MEIAGNKIKLREYRDDDYTQLKYWCKGDQEWKKLDGPYFKKPQDDEVDAIIDKQMEKDRAHTGVPSSLVIADLYTDSFYGEVTRYWICKKTEWPALGILIYDPQHWGKGYATEALTLWEQYLFANMPCSWRFDIETWSGNIGMMKVAEKLGYKLEGKFTDARRVGDKFYDSLRYGKLRSANDCANPSQRTI